MTSPPAHLPSSPHSQPPEDVARALRAITDEMATVLVGQQHLVERLLVALLSDGHLLVEGVPGLAKTTAVKALAATISAAFQRIQFTPDLLPGDLVGTLIYQPGTGTFATRKGPIFANIVLADEINRAPAKVHSALLEAMEERQVTIGENTFPLDDLFVVMATQNPIEQDGTYPLPEAQLDRFMLKVKVSYPTPDEERQIVRQRGMAREVRAVAGPDTIAAGRAAASAVYLDRKVEDYLLDIVFATRRPAEYGLPDLQPSIRYGASPRAAIWLASGARALAYLRGRDYVVPDDVKSLAPDVLRHRIIPTYEAAAEGITTDDIIGRILSTVPVP